ncbi:amphi-Trp domain-containing protein [Haloarculaceae archaeon H-GB2-1]|nr:amphi-Trp domain-containing protein [Haloarculaceae archaeon H-GB1-1]MEA5387509.1 amphi-Trp domain-containing protein [Haloarculaceae archaeon H-GB11]MEA5408991.1 amphi-Trp domain-containing protein [Haloarculaceae archaeon H-GB2-1]
MPEEVLFEAESHESRASVAAYLRAVADKLERGKPLTLEADGQSITLEVPDRTEFEVKAEREGPAGQPGELSVEFELEWDEGAGSQDRGGLEIR